MYENLSMYECVGGKEIVYENILYIIPTSYKVINIIIGETKRESWDTVVQIIGILEFSKILIKKRYIIFIARPSKWRPNPGF